MGRIEVASSAGMGAMALLDAHVGRIVDAVADAGLTARTTFFVVSDHGFKTVRRQVRPNAALARAGLLTVTDGKITRADAYVVPEGGTALVYVTSPDADGTMLERMKQALAGLEGIDHIVAPADFAGYGLPRPEDNAQMGATSIEPQRDQRGRPSGSIRSIGTLESTRIRGSEDRISTPWHAWRSSAGDSWAARWPRG